MNQRLQYLYICDVKDCFEIFNVFIKRDYNKYLKSLVTHKFAIYLLILLDRSNDNNMYVFIYLWTIYYLHPLT